MNNSRRKQIADALSKIETAYDLLCEVKDEEEMAYENLPESLRSSERGEVMQENIDNLDEAIQELDEAKSTLDNIG